MHTDCFSCFIGCLLTKKGWYRDNSLGHQGAQSQHLYLSKEKIVSQLESRGPSDHATLSEGP